MFFIRILLVVIAITSMSSICYAKKDISEPVFDFADVSLEELLDAEVEIVSSSKTREKNIESNSSVSIISENTIRIYGYSSIKEVLDNTLSVSTFNNFLYTDAIFRGIGVVDTFLKKSLIMINGHTINDQWSGDVSLDTDQGISIGDIKQIEVIRGSGSSIYGANAFLSVINLITKKGKDIDGVELETNWNYYKGNDIFNKYYNTTARVGKRFGKLDIMATLSFIEAHESSFNYPEVEMDSFDQSFIVREKSRCLNQSEGFDEYCFSYGGKTDPKAALRQQIGLYSRAVYYINDNRKLTLSTHFNKAASGIPTAEFYIVHNSTDALVSDTRNFVEFKWEDKPFSNISYFVRGYKSSLEWYNRLPYIWNNMYEEDEETESIIPSDMSALRTNWFDIARSNSLGVEFQSTLSIFDGLKLLVGAEYQKINAEQSNYEIACKDKNPDYAEELEPYEGFDCKKVLSDNQIENLIEIQEEDLNATEEEILPYSNGSLPDSQRDLTGVYAQLRYDLLKSISLTAGSRFDYIYDNLKKVSESKLSPRGSIIYFLNNITAFKLIYNEAFKVPSIYEREFTDFSEVTTNYNLKSESIRSIELLFETNKKISSTSGIKIQSGVFHNYMNNLIVPVDVCIKSETEGNLILDSNTEECDDSNYRIQNRNFAATESYGFELGLAFYYLKHAAFSNITLVNAHSMNTETKKFSHFVNSPYYYGSFGTSLVVFKDYLRFVFTMNYKGEVLTNREELKEIKPQLMANTKLLYSHFSWLDADISFNNITNSQYRSVASENIISPYIISNPFNIKVQLRFKF